MGQQSKVGKVATHVMVTNGRISVRYHDTLVVDITPESITLDSGGWRTATTKTRMNQASNQFGLGYIVYQKAHTWFVDVVGIDGGYLTLRFFDGISFARKP